MDNPILMVILGILCTCSILQLVILAAILIRLLLHKTSKKITDWDAPTASKASPHLSSLEEEKLKEQRRKFDAEMEAFQELLNYNADVAYGINKETDNVR